MANRYPISKYFFALYLLYDKNEFSTKSFIRTIFPKSNFTKFKNDKDDIWNKANSLPNIRFLQGSSTKKKVICHLKIG